jgi:phosphoribosylcarboxyaminoimidazole (NCAIR) mutase
METIIIESSDIATTQQIKDFLKELKVAYKTKSKKDKEKPYDPAFVDMIIKATHEKGCKVIDQKNLWQSIKS